MITFSPKVVANQLRAAHEASIRTNGVMLRFLREVRSRQGGGFSPWTESPPGGMRPYLCMVAFRTMGFPHDAGGDAGRKQTDDAWVLSAPADVPFVADDNSETLVRIETSHPLYGRLRVHDLKPLAYGTEIWGWQARLEAIR